jgi:hypothetical protein
MADRMDLVIAAAVRQGFWVHQTRTGAWHFSKRGSRLIVERQPVTPTDWWYLIRTLRGMGLRFPEGE